jgi:deoxyribodipyrimidine photolyase-related protein
VNTIWVLGDQLNRNLGALANANPDGDRVLLIHSQAKLASKRWHRQRAHLIITAMKRFAIELRAEGFEVNETHRRFGPAWQPTAKYSSHRELSQWSRPTSRGTSC